MRAFITGISGQDGSYLSELLLSKGYEVFGMIRRHSVAENQQYRLSDISDKINVFYGDMTDAGRVEELINEVRPDEVYNLAAQSHVRISFDIPHFTAQTNAIGVLNILEAVRKYAPKAKFYQASSSEMFGLSVDGDSYQRESTPMNPASPYGITKVFAYNMVRHYRRAYKLHACNGILFNHESPRRGANFVTKKVVIGACEIYLGRQDSLELGNMDSYRDWGHSKDYVRAMNMIINADPSDWVVATGETHSIREMCEVVFSYLNMDYKDYVIQNPKYMRPEELPYLRGDSSRIRATLGWSPEYTFETLLKEMVDDYLQKNTNKL
jgi:GDPmannose 4,6-dehydratase